ncbi:hypothetical protein BDK51DRAFT_31156, partial [Blyttiomyces helicus]
TLEWPSLPVSLGFQFPYVIALLKNNMLDIHNLFTQQRVQMISLPASLDPRFLADAPWTLSLADGTIRVALGCRETIMGLSMASLEAQVEMLLEARSVERAVALAEQISVGDRGGDAERKVVKIGGAWGKAKLQSLYQRAAVFYLRELLFEEALQLFKKGAVDPRVLISMFPDVASVAGTPALAATGPEEWVAGLGTIDDLGEHGRERERDIRTHSLRFADENPRGLGSWVELAAELPAGRCGDD